MFRRIGYALFLGLTVAHASAQVGLVRPGGLRAFGPKSAIIWSNPGATFKLWKMDATGPAVTITPVPPPVQLLQQLKKQYAGAIENDDSFGGPDVEIAGDEIRVLWFEELPQSQAEFEKHGDQPQALVQASTTDLGATWRIDRSPFRDGPVMESVDLYAAADAQHAWLMGVSEPGAGQLPAILLRTADGGRTWKEADGTGSRSMPIGSSGAQVFDAKDATHAWFIATCAGCDDDKILNASYTDDGGRFWHGTKLVLQYPECAKCFPSHITRASVAAGDCFDVSLNPGTEGDVRHDVPAHFCSPDGGHTWDKPQAGLAISPQAGFRFRQGWNEFMLYAQGDSKLGMTTDFFPMPRDETHKEDWNRYRLLETRDGGHNWRAILPELRDLGMSAKSLQVNGDLVWLLLSSSFEERILLSRDRGATWAYVWRPAAK